MTRANVILLGFLVLLLGGLGYLGFRFIGFDGFSAGIASEAVLVLGVFIWVGSYLLRVITGKMTFNEQRKRYIKTYEDKTTVELQTRFNAMSDEEQIRLIQEIDTEEDSISETEDL